jgi:putative ABC transport system ATP-binding protein
MQQPDQLVIALSDIHKEYKLKEEAIPVLHGVSLEVAKADYIAVMGQSGSGKSTLLNIIGCLDTPTSGTYLFNNQPISSFSQNQLAEVRNRQIGFVFQSFNLLPKLDIAANVELPLIYGNVPKRERRQMVMAILERFGLANRHAHKPNEISGGQKQRVAIARALVKKPAIILADEPTGNLDSHTTGEILDLFHQLHDEGNTIVLITHESDVASRAGRTLHLVDGVFRS